MLSAVHTFSPLELCERGEHEAAAELAGLRAGEWPSRGSEGDSEHAMALLVAGIISTAGGGIRQPEEMAIPRQMLAESICLFNGEPGAQVARYWLGLIEYWAGNLTLALSPVLEVLASEIDSTLRFRTSLLKGVILSVLGFPDLAFAELQSIAVLYDAQNDLMKGKFHSERGRLLRIMKQTDRAIVEYDSALHFFRDDPRCLGIAANNLAGVYLDTEQFSEAHTYAERAQETFHRLGDKTFEAQAWDQAALIFLAEGKPDKARNAIDHAMSLASTGIAFNECRATRDKIKTESETRIQPAHVKMRGTPQCFSQQPEPKGAMMVPIESASQLIQNDPRNALTLLDLLYWATSARDNPRHEAELDEVEEMLYAKTPDGEKHRAEYRSSRLIREAISDS